MDRLEKIRQVVDGILRNQQDVEERRCGFVHLYGVSAICAMLALKRGLDAEIASIAGMLHDIYSYRTGLTQYHAHNGEEDVRVILRDLGVFTDEEQHIIRMAIFRHSDKEMVHQPYDELLKDADTLQHYLYNTQFPLNVRVTRRLQNVLSELNLPYNPKVTCGKEEKVVVDHSVKNRRALLANIAESLAKKPLIGNENKSGPDVYPIIRYFPDSDLDNGFDWCASFVYHCCMEAGFILPIKYPNPVPSRFAGVLAWLVWAKLPENQFYYSTEDQNFVPERGDLVIFDHIIPNGPHDHIGVVLEYEDGVLITAEGNVENRSGIFKRDRYENINGFIRIDNGYDYKTYISGPLSGNLNDGNQHPM